jgi:hypothetical protein
MRILIRLLLAGFLLLGTLGSAIACSSAAPYDDYAAVCVDGNGVRVPDEFCPIGDGIVNAGNQWSYYGYYRNTPDLVIPYVGYPVSRGWDTNYTTVHNHVTNINIHRGPDVAPATAPAGQTGTAADVPIAGGKPQAYAGSGTVQRGGLGVKARSVTVPGASKRTVSSAPKTRAQAPSRPASRKK